MDILQEFGVDFRYGTLGPSLDWNIDNYVAKKAQFHQSLHQLRQAFMVREEAVAAKKFLFPYDFLQVSEVAEFYQQVQDYITEMESEDWIYSHLVEEMEDFNTDPYCDHKDLRKVVYVYATIKSEDQPTTVEQGHAVHFFKIAKREFEQAKSSLEYAMKEFD